MPSVVFEIRADQRGIKHYMHIPDEMADIMSQARGHLQARTKRLHRLDEVEWQVACESV